MKGGPYEENQLSGRSIPPKLDGREVENVR